MTNLPNDEIGKPKPKRKRLSIAKNKMKPPIDSNLIELTINYEVEDVLVILFHKNKGENDNGHSLVYHIFSEAPYDYNTSKGLDVDNFVVLKYDGEEEENIYPNQAIPYFSKTAVVNNVISYNDEPSTATATEEEGVLNVINQIEESATILYVKFTHNEIDSYISNPITFGNAATYNPGLASNEEGIYLAVTKVEDPAIGQAVNNLVLEQVDGANSENEYPLTLGTSNITLTLRDNEQGGYKFE